MPKINVYVPDDLAEQVRACGVQVSSICQAALRDEVARSEASAAVTSDMQAVVERLRGTRIESDVQDHDLGRDHGVEWAREYANWNELVNIAEHCEQDWPAESIPHELPTVTDWIRDHEHVPVPKEVEPYYEGFADGAREVYEAVKAEIYRR